MDPTEAPRPDLATASPASPASAAPLPPPGWYADPWRVEPWRWWDGGEWTGWAGVTETPAPRARRTFVRPGVVPPRRTVERADPAAEPGMRGGGIAFAGFLLSSVVATGLLWLATRDGSRSIGLVLGFYLFLWGGLLATCAVAVQRRGTGSLTDLGLQGPSWRAIGIGVAAGLVIWFTAVQVAARLLPFLDRDDLRQTRGYVRLLDADWLTVVVFAVVAILGAPFFEELFFRGLVQGVLVRRYGSRIAIVVQALLFTTVHFTYDMSAARLLLTFVTIGIAGLGLGWLRWRYRSLAYGMVAHSTFNTIVTIATLVLLSQR